MLESDLDPIQLIERDLDEDPDTEIVDEVKEQHKSIFEEEGELTLEDLETNL